MLGRRSFSRRARAGFTLVEIVLVLGLIALIASFTAIGLEGLSSIASRQPIQETFYDHLREGRVLAKETRQPILLTFDAESGLFQLRPQKGAPKEGSTADIDEPTSTLVTFNLEDEGKLEESEEIEDPESPQTYPNHEIVFEALEPDVDGSFGSEDWQRDEPFPELVIHPSGAVTPARVVIQPPEGESMTLRFDPFSTGPAWEVAE